MISATLSTKHRGRVNYDLRLSRYIGDDAPRIELLSAGNPELTATISLQEVHLTPDEGCVYIKDWGENEGLFDSMIEAGLIEDMRMIVTIGKCEAKQGLMNETLRHEFSKIKRLIH